MSEFRFKQTTIQQSDKVFKVGTDAMILGSLLFGNPRRILDVGCGTGILSLMAAQRFASAEIHALDVNEHAVELSKINFNRSVWSSRLQVFHKNIMDLNIGNYDLIVSNPPFFEEEFKSVDENMRMAKHHTRGFFKDWIAECDSKLSPDGSIFLILPADRMNIIHSYVRDSTLFLSQTVSVKGKRLLPVKRKVVVMTKAKSEFRESGLTVYEDSGEYTEEYKRLTQEFYTRVEFFS